MKEHDELKRVGDCLGIWLGLIRSSNAIDFYDINRVSEDVASKLLNLVYDLELDNLNRITPNYPGIDLGDTKNGIAFQVTSRKDTEKIRENLKTFSEKYTNTFPNGIRFLILNFDKPGLNEEKYKKIYDGFNPKSHILNDKDLLREIQKIYHDTEKRHRFQQILDFLEETFRDGKPVDPLKILRDNSKTYYDALRGPNGRFRFLNISDIILTKPRGFFEKPPLDPEKHLENHLIKDWHNISETLQNLWKKKVRHTVITGEGGMGKTVSLIHLWDKFLADSQKKKNCQDLFEKRSRHPQKLFVNKKKDCNEQLPINNYRFESLPIPIFIALNELNQVSEPERKGFILHMIRQNYGNSEIPLASIETLMQTPLTLQGTDDFIPSVVLLLDGFNEITVEKRELLIELNRLAEQCPRIQVVITGRSDMRPSFNWNHWNLVELKALEDHQIETYLQEKKMAVPRQERLLSLLRNPMMLTLYAASCEVQARHTGSAYCCFKEKVETTAQLLWNFMEAQVGNLPERLGQDQGKIYYYKFLLKHFLPALGFEMEKARLFDFTVDQLDACIDRLCVYFSQPGFFDTFREFDEYIEKLPLGECAGHIAQRKRRSELKRILCDELHMVVREGESFRFLHQNFRDFFAAVHILNEVEVGIRKSEIPVVLEERVLDYYVRRMIGELEGEHKVKPYLKKPEGWKIDIDKESRLYKVLELCRGRFNNIEKETLTKVFGPTFLQKGRVGYAVWNIVTIWKEVRGELSGVDLARLDLSGIQFNRVRCSRLYGERYLAADFAGSRVHEKNIFPQGHTFYVNSAVYSPDGKKILSASDDQTIKEWDVETGECVRTLEGHRSYVNSAVYSPDGKKILSASSDQTIKEWDGETGECVTTLAGHTSRVNSAVYSPDGKKILSASWDQTIKEWDGETGECVTTLAGHTDKVWSAEYSRDGKKILSASSDQTIKEWDVETGECLRTLEGHTGWVNSAVVSPDGKKILSASSDNTIKEWDAGTGECVTTLEGHTSVLSSAVYSPDGKKILSASRDQTIKEWDGETGECVRTLEGHTSSVESAVYSPDGKKILSASEDETIKEWDGETGECLRTLAGHKDSVRSALYSPDGKKILSRSEDNTIKEWDAETGECLRTLASHTGWVNSAVYSPDGKKILSASHDHTIKEWDAGTGACLRTLEGHTDWVTSAEYSPDGIKILSASSDNTIKEWDAGTGECVTTLEGHTDWVTSAEYSPDGIKILSASWDETIKEWDVETGQCLKTHKKDDHPDLSEYRTGKMNSTLETDDNKIIVPAGRGKKKREIIDVPGLWIQGCSFQNLEKGSKWTEEGRRILEMYGGKR